MKLTSDDQQPKSAKRVATARRNGSYGGRVRASRHDPAILCEWSSRGGKAVLEKYGREYFKGLRRRRKRYPKQSVVVAQTSPRVVAARKNGQRGGLARAEKHDAAELKGWARMGGLATRSRHGPNFFRGIRKLRKQYRKGYVTRKTKKRLQAEAREINERLNRRVDE